MTRRFRTYGEVSEPGSAEVLEQVLEQQARVRARLGGVRLLAAVASGKGGVGKSAITANLAALLAARGLRVGALDADVNGPSLARMLGASRAPLVVGEEGIVPATGAEGVRVVSMDLLLADDHAPVRWREPGMGAFIWQSALETGALREFLADIAWGELDVLLLDLPPGTDKLARLIDLAPPGLLLLVETPSRAARHVVAMSARQAAEAGLKRIALITNMDGYVCAHCGEPGPLFGMETDEPIEGVERWARVPMDPAFAARTDAGAPGALALPASPTARALAEVAGRIEAILREREAA